MGRTALRWILGLLQREYESNGYLFSILCRDPSDWSAETMEDLSPLLLLDDNAISALPNEVCFLLSGQGSSIGCPMFVLFHIFVNKSSNGQHEEAMVHVRIFHDVFCLFSTLSVSLV